MNTLKSIVLLDFWESERAEDLDDVRQHRFAYEVEPTKEDLDEIDKSSKARQPYEAKIRLAALKEKLIWKTQTHINFAEPDKNLIQSKKKTEAEELAELDELLDDMSSESVSDSSDSDSNSN